MQPLILNEDHETEQTKPFKNSIVNFAVCFIGSIFNSYLCVHK